MSLLGGRVASLAFMCGYLFLCVSLLDVVLGDLVDVVAVSCCRAALSLMRLCCVL